MLTFDQAVGAKEAELTMHARITEPIYNILLLLLGVPFILSRERNLKTSAGLCMLAVMSCFLFIYLCKHLDMAPSLRAWLPLMIFGPIAAVTVDSIKT
ncbi:MAG: LptF/LptG family permease [Planctomycetota bacterium]|nr:LptF/LptG family permease [Planctomycetota bacterium]